jgi:hypothetical protein
MNGKLVSLAICETAQAKRGKETAAPASAKSAPHYFEKSVPQQYIISQERIEIGGKPGDLVLKTYQPSFFLAEARFDLEDAPFEEIFSFKEDVTGRLSEYLKEKGGRDVDEFSEEYSVFIISGYKGNPEQFLDKRETIAGLLKSERSPLNEEEIDYTLSYKIKYAKDDLVIIDWDGAFIFDPEGDYESTLELLELANFQLLRYRIFDRELESRLQRVSHAIETTPAERRFFFKRSEMHGALREFMILRSRSISDFQALDRDIKLIGDWYSARLYELVSKKFKLDDWRSTVKSKLDALEDAYTIASEKFTRSWEEKNRIIEIIAWYVLLIGWFVLLALDFYFYKMR